MKRNAFITLFGVLVSVLTLSPQVYAADCTSRTVPSIQSDSIRISSSHDTFDRLPNYYATVKNTDSPDCGVSTYMFGVNAPSGWDQSAVPDSVDLKPGESATVKVFVKPTDDTKKGTYPVYLIIHNWTARFETSAWATKFDYSFVVTDDPKPGPTRTPAPLRERNVRSIPSPTATPTTQIRPSSTPIATTTPITQRVTITPIPTQTDQSGSRSWWDILLQFLSRLIGK